MYLKDFVYCGDSLSNHDCIIGSLVTGNENSISNGSEMTQNTVKNFATSQNTVLNVSYDSPITATFDIFKDDCSTTELYFEDTEISYFMRWLMQKTPATITPIYDDTSYPGLYFIGTFTTINLIYMQSQVIGLTLTFTADSPWGYTKSQHTYGDYSTNTGVTEFTITDLSDEIGTTYPTRFDVTITSLGTGTTLTIKNNMREGYDTVVKNCSVGEVLSFDCKNKIIQSSNHSKLYNDFNFVFPCMANTFSNRKNTFTLSQSCLITLEYNPIRKVGFIV